jgi:dTMP kinase
MMQGKFIVIDGPDGAGKTSIIKELQKELDPQKFFFTYEPFQQGLHDMVYISSVHKMLKFMYDREFHTKLRVLPALNDGVNVICDRGITASIVYQGMELYREQIKKGYPDCDQLYVGSMWFVRKMHDLWAKQPDTVILFDLPWQVCAQRCESRGKEVYKEALETICKGYKYLPELTPGIQDYQIVDANRPINDVLAEVRGIIGEIGT